MASIKNQIADFVVSSNCLDFATGKPAGLTIRRGGLIASTTTRQPEMLVYVGPEIQWNPVGVRRSGNPILRAFTLIVEIRANGSIPDEVLDPLEVWAEKRLFADETMGSLATGIVGWRTEQDGRQSDLGYFVATVYADIEFTAQRGLPETKGDG